MMDTTEVYHAGTAIVDSPDCKYGRPDLDFGQGFYVTDIYDQAKSFAVSKSEERRLPGKINIYLLQRKDILKEAKSKIFKSYNAEWLDFILACRAGKDVWKEYDYVEGGVADDRVINTVNLYIQGYLSQKEALRRLRYLKPNNQICILNQEMLDKYLKFTDCISLHQDGLL